MSNDPNNEKSGAQRVAQAAGAAKGAIKTGKALATAAKGSALGPYGMAAGFAWENRKVIGKIIIAAVAILMIPVMLLSMLPSFLVGWMFPDGDTPDTDSTVAEDLVFNDSNAIIDLHNEICVDVDAVIGEAHQSVLDSVSTDSASYGEDAVIVIQDPYSEELPHDATRIVCEYSAAIGLEETVDKDSLKNKLSEHKDSLFSYTKTEETKTRVETVTNEDGNVTEQTVEYKEITYTVHYVGNDYITNSIFNLTDEQKELAADYADSLELYGGDDTDG